MVFFSKIASMMLEDDDDEADGVAMAMMVSQFETVILSFRFCFCVFRLVFLVFFLLAKQSVIGMGMSQQCKCKCKCKTYDYETIFLATHFFFFHYAGGFIVAGR